MNDTWQLFYDGGCNLCHESKLRAEQWAEQRHRPLVAMPLQSQEAWDRGFTGDEMKLVADGETYGAVDAWIKLLSIAPWYLRWLYPIGRTRIGRAVMRPVYNLVARYRKKWFGSRACALPKPTHRNDS